MTHSDLHDLRLTTASAAAAEAFNTTVLGYLRYRTDVSANLKATLDADPDFALAHVMKGYLMMLSFKEANVPTAVAALKTADGLIGRTTPREQAHAAGLRAWTEGDLDRTLAIWEQILDEYPHDILALRLHHSNAFWLGRPGAMAREVEKALPRYSRDLAGWGTLLACRCFAHEELGNYTLAEAAGRDAIDVDKGDLWAAHAVAHILEMQGRCAEGIDWLAGLEPHWEGANNLKHHLWWHRGLYHFERGEFDAVLGLYDRHFRNLASPITEAQPDLYIDVQNAASMLFRLERLGVDVGSRWNEIADKAETRIGDCLSPFTLPHWMMALAATRRFEAGGRMLEAMRKYATTAGTLNARLVADYALPISEAVLLRAKGEPAAAVRIMRPSIGGMYRLGGSHAQQDVLEQLFLDCAVAAGSNDDVALILARVAGRHPVPPERRMGYKHAAHTLS
ncbi:MAG: tetratricopeptide repeat protein [Hyphomicrobium sp.]|nr:tetratricopeptide repeat protein [Hyphomicrobium sp.]